MPTISQKELNKTKNRIGLYRSLDKPAIDTIRPEVLKELVTKLVERAFRQYVQARKAPIDMENMEWKRFNKFLQKNL